MKHILFILLVATVVTSCKKSDSGNPTPDPGTGTGNVPEKVTGQWLYGTFAMADFWAYDGTYLGNPFSLSVAFDFKTDGTYEMYYSSEANDYGCRSDAFSYFKGNVDFKDDSSFILYPKEGNFRGFYNCTPQYNFNRPALSSELAVDTLYYTFETDEYGKEWMVVRFDPNDEYGSYFDKTTW